MTKRTLSTNLFRTRMIAKVSISSCQLDTKTLLVWNDGRRFDEADVRNICSIGSSDKDLTQIGNFRYWLQSGL